MSKSHAEAKTELSQELADPSKTTFQKIHAGVSFFGASFFYPYSNKKEIANTLISLPGGLVVFPIVAIGCTLGALGFVVKAGKELVTGDFKKAGSSLVTSGVFVCASIVLLLLTALTPLIMLVELATRSAATLKEHLNSDVQSIVMASV